MQVNPVHAPVKAVASVVSKPVVTEPSHTLKAQLAVAVKSMPKPKKPKIIIIGMQGAQANEIEKEFPKFEIVHLLHGNDKIKDKIKSAQKVLGIEQKLGSSAKMIKEMHGSNFVMLKFGMTNIRHQLGIWETCYLQDPTYFNMSEAERVNYS
jgi:hypothetical protein